MAALLAACFFIIFFLIFFLYDKIYLWFVLVQGAKGASLDRMRSNM